MYVQTAIANHVSLTKTFPSMFMGIVHRFIYADFL